MRGKTIRQFLIDGIPNGRWVCELSNWTGKAYKIPRTYVNSCDDRVDLSYTGVYFLFGQNEESEIPQAYISEAENITTANTAALVGQRFPDGVRCVSLKGAEVTF